MVAIYYPVAIHTCTVTIPLDLNLTLASIYSRAPNLFFEQSVDTGDLVLHALMHDLHMTLVSIYARKH